MEIIKEKSTSLKETSKNEESPELYYEKDLGVNKISNKYRQP